MQTTKRSRKYRKKRHTGSKAPRPNLAGAKRREREAQELSLKMVLNHPDQPDGFDGLNVDDHEDFE